jgi:glycosyltransferase involved in cell wall biosynthesis
MKILYIKYGMHHKNHNSMMSYKNITLYIIEKPDILNTLDLSQFDCVYSPSMPIDVNKYPNTKFIFGPHFSVFPEKKQMDIIQGLNSIYIQPSEWALNAWKIFPCCTQNRLEILPFGVDTVSFNEIKPITERSQVFIYFKRRLQTDLDIVYRFLCNNGYNPIIFDYVKRYNETDYINCLKNAKFGFWLDAHESQGFALQEALACNVPLLVWSVTSMSQEEGSSYKDIPAQTNPYWDDRCGEYFTDIQQLETTFNKFITNLSNYKPREFILENLSIEKCEQKLINIIQNI